MSSTQGSGISTSTIVIASIGTLTAAVCAYAIYFDQKRRTDPDFRRQLKRARKQLSKAEEANAEQEQVREKDKVKNVLAERKHEISTNLSPEQAEAQFMDFVAEGEQMTGKGADPIDIAWPFYKALRIYPQPAELMAIYDKTIEARVRDIIAEWISLDPDSSITSRRKSADATFE